MAKPNVSTQELGRLAADRLRGEGHPEMVVRERAFLDSPDPFSFAGLVRINGNSRDSCAAFSRGARVLQVAIDSGARNQQTIDKAISEMNDLWTQSHHVRAVGIQLLDIADQVGQLAEVTRTMTFQSKALPEDLVLTRLSGDFASCSSRNSWARGFIAPDRCIHSARPDAEFMNRALPILAGLAPDVLDDDVADLALWIEHNRGAAEELKGGTLGRPHGARLRHLGDDVEDDLPAGPTRLVVRIDCTVGMSDGQPLAPGLGTGDESEHRGRPLRS